MPSTGMQQKEEEQTSTQSQSCQTPRPSSSPSSQSSEAGTSSWAALAQMKAKEGGSNGSTVSTDTDSGSYESDSEGRVTSDSPNEAESSHKGSTEESCVDSSKEVSQPDCVVVVDPVSTGANVADAFLRAGYAVIAVKTGKTAHEAPIPANCPLRRDYLTTLAYDATDPASIAAALKRLPARLIGIVSGSELGVEACDRLTELLGLPSNGSALSEARRDKSAMQEQVRAAGVRAAKQVRASSWAEVECFLDWESMPAVVVKPARSAGSDHVVKAVCTAQTRAAFDAIFGAPNALGGVNTAVVVQEFLQGTEYVVDSVSRDGMHKVVAIWEYDKRNFLGADFIYFGQRAVSGTEGPGASLVRYATQVLNALGIRHGATHAEIILTPTGPCLVEVGCRPQGNEGTFMPLADRVWGYNQVGALVAATTNQAAFDALPSVCDAGMVHGLTVDFVAEVEGRIRAVRHLDAMQSLSSFMRFDLLPAVGDHLHRTVDCFTACGSVTMVHEDKHQLEADCAVVRKLNESMWIVDDDSTYEE